MELIWNRDYSLTKGVFSVNTLIGRLKISYDINRMPSEGKFGTAKLVFRHNKFFLNIPVTQEVSDINAGDIGYKIAQRLGGFDAYGPILLGLNAPINDLSRGCNAIEVYSMAIITAALAE